MLFAFSFSRFFPLPYSLLPWRLSFFCFSIRWWHILCQFTCYSSSSRPPGKANGYCKRERESAWSGGDWPSLKQMHSLFWLSMVKNWKSSNTAIGVSTPVPDGLSLRCNLLFSFFFFKILFIYSWEPQREGQRHRQWEKQAPCREPSEGLDPGIPGSCPEPKAGVKPLSHPGIPKC